MLDMIDEGVAYKKELNRYLDKDRKLKDRVEKYNTIADNTSGEISRRARNISSDFQDDRNWIAKKNWRFTKYGEDDSTETYSDAADGLHNHIQNAKHGYPIARDALHKMKRDYALNHGDKGNDIRDKKPGQIQDLYDKIHNKPKAKNESAQIEYIKETCEYILSIIDEM